jgi:hypothetical protein
MRCGVSRNVANRLIGVAAAVAVGSCYGAAAAQTTAMPVQMNMADHRGAIQGRVSNASGAPLTDATVTAVNDENGAQFTSATDQQGAYSFGALPVGKYTISIVNAGVTTFRRRGINVGADASQTLDIRLDASTAAEAAEADRQDLLQKIATLEQRINDLESSTVLSDPETRVRRVEVYVDAQGGEHTEAIPGVEPTVTYERERVYRRQTINEKIEEALAAADEQSVSLGIDAATVTQGAARTRGRMGESGNAYALASADLFFTAKLAQYTVFFADVVALSGSPPDAEVPTLSLLNGYTARLETQNALNLREVWLRTELFGQRLALTAGRLDLTNYFDANAFANDESTQFLSDALVNNQMLGLGSNGTGVAAEFDAKTGLRFKFGFQQSNNDAQNLSDSLFTLSEVGYTFTPFALPEGTYRVWFRTDNTEPGALRKGAGVSLDQKITNSIGLFGRYGTQEIEGINFGDGDKYYSAGVGFQNGLIFFPQDSWGIGWAHLDLASTEKEHLAEGYYNFQLTDRLRLSFNLTYVLDEPEEGGKFGYVLPGVRFQASF